MREGERGTLLFVASPHTHQGLAQSFVVHLRIAGGIGEDSLHLNDALLKTLIGVSAVGGTGSCQHAEENQQDTQADEERGPLVPPIAEGPPPIF